MIEKLDSMFRKRFTSAIEDCGRLAASLLVKRIFVRDPRATSVLHPQQLRLAHDVVDVVATLFIGKMGTDSFNVACIKLFFELLRWHTVSAG